MGLTEQFVRSIFCGLATDGGRFFDHVAETVDWTVKGSHPLAGRYRCKSDFRRNTFERIDAVLAEPARLEVGHILVERDWAAVELTLRARAKSGMMFDNDYCWLVRFAGETIVEVRAYLDSALVARLFEENGDGKQSKNKTSLLAS